MARTTTFNYLADGPPETTPASTWFAWADNDDDPFSREQDLYYLALALERHDHRDGRGLSVGRIDAGSIDVAALSPNSVTSAAIADGAVGTNELADNAVTSAKILNETILGVDLHVDAIKDRLGYVPVNKAGDTELGSMSWGEVGPPTTSSTLTLLNDSDIVLGTGGISGAGSISLSRTTPGTVAYLSTTSSLYMPLVLRNFNADAASTSYAMSVLNNAATSYDFILDNTTAQFGGIGGAQTPIHVNAERFQSYITNTGATAGIPPFSASSTVICTNLNAHFLQGLEPAAFAPVARQVPSLVHAFAQTAAGIPAGWARNTSGDGRIIVGAGTTVGVGGGTPFTENGHQGSSWSAGGGAHTHSIADHTHFLSNAPGKNAGSIAGGSDIIALLRSGTNDTYPYTFPSTGSAGGSSAWNFPTYGLVLIYKS